jgi:hypothetical protein
MSELGEREKAELAEYLRTLMRQVNGDGASQPAGGATATDTDVAGGGAGPADDDDDETMAPATCWRETSAVGLHSLPGARLVTCTIPAVINWCS